MPQGESYKLSNSLSVELSLSKKIKGLFHIKNKGDFNKSIAVVKNTTDESNTLTKNFQVNHVEDAASRVITAFMRKNISDNAYNYMFTSGISWKGVPEMYQAKGLELIRKISKENISNLRKELQSLDHDEKSFLDSILTVKLRATHASNANLENENGVLGIYSRKLLIKKHIPFPEENSTSKDIKFLSNDDFVFFSLEPGEDFKKPSSRFGSSIYSIDINTPVFEQVSCISLYDQVTKEAPNPSKYIHGISQKAARILQEKAPSIHEFMFFGKEMRVGLGLYLLKRIRMIPDNDKQKILSMKSEQELNNVINGILRPEIKVPKYFFSKEYTTAIFDGNGGFLDPKKINNKEYMLDKVAKNYKALAHASENLKNDYDIALSAVSQGGTAIMSISDKLKKNREIIMAAVKTSGNALKFADKKFKDDKEVVLAAVQQSGESLKFASTRLTKDRSIILAAVKSSGIALRYANEKFKDDKEVVLAAVQQSGEALKFASERLKNDRDILLTAVQLSGVSLLYFPNKFRDDKQLVLIAVQNNGILLQHTSERLKDDEDVVKKAVQGHPAALLFSSDRLKNDMDTVLFAVKHHGKALQYASKSLKDNDIIVSAAINNDKNAAKYASDRIKNALILNNL
ncbi:DUF4116 domain-containing protein [Salmonella bongori]|uniref:DUF4116 domain-containing protein n=1 Tax=Salmonella bongori TaxID=54736 RepID=UPI0009A9CB49|nr:DUF4116 domain-containing protein [Salmonella bongori]EDP8647562.1 DUF4116 domain-containing protein [Salmonella bongori]HAB1660426.1 DUF4116 domain-containing protein [Salmonella bongori]